MAFRRRYHLPPPLLIAPHSDPSAMSLSLSDMTTTTDVSGAGGVSATSFQSTSFSPSHHTTTGAAASTAAAFIEACRSRPPRRKACDYAQVRSILTLVFVKTNTCLISVLSILLISSYASLLQCRSDALVSQASSLRLVLATALPTITTSASSFPHSSAPSSSAADMDIDHERRQPGRLAREPLYLASI